MHSDCLQTRGSSEFRKKTSFQHKFRNGLLDNSSSSRLTLAKLHRRMRERRGRDERATMAGLLVSLSVLPVALLQNAAWGPGWKRDCLRR